MLNREIYDNYSLNVLEQDCWARLVTGATKSRNPFHTPCVASFSDGEISLRTVVLRKTLPLERELRFHTDIRSPKWKELLNNPRVRSFMMQPSEFNYG